MALSIPSSDYKQILYFVPHTKFHFHHELLPLQMMNWISVNTHDLVSLILEIYYHSALFLIASLLWDAVTPHFSFSNYHCNMEAKDSTYKLSYFWRAKRTSQSFTFSSWKLSGWSVPLVLLKYRLYWSTTTKWFRREWCEKCFITLFFALLTTMMTNGSLEEKLDLNWIKKVNQKEA